MGLLEEAKECNDIERLKVLASNSDELVRINVASNKNINKYILNALLDDSSPLVRSVAINNKVCDKRMISERLGIEDNETILVSLALNKDTDEDILETLIFSKYSSVRLSVAKNNNVPKKCLLLLLDDNDKRVVNEVLSNPKISEDVLRKQIEVHKRNHSVILDGVTKNPNLPQDLIERFAKSKDPLILRNIANNPNTPSELLVRLSKSFYADVRRACALNPKLPKKNIEILAKDKNKSVQLTANYVLSKGE